MPTSGTGSGTPILGGPSITGMDRHLPRTWLTLDDWRRIVGVNPLFFWGIQSALSPPDTGCDYWMQYSHQDSARVSRYELAEAILEAERMISDYVGYNLLPDWTYDARIKASRPARATHFSAGYNVRSQSKSVRLPKGGHFISGGQQAKTLIDDSVGITLSDQDNDGWEESCTVTVSTAVTNVNEIRVYVPGYSGDDNWEIRPVKVTISGGVATIRFNTWLAVNPVYYEGFGRNAVDGDTNDFFLDSVDVYRVWNDPQSQVTLVWEADGPGQCGCELDTCAACSYSTQAGCIVTKDERLGLVFYHPATWNATDSTFSSVYGSVSRDPDRLRLNYLSGWQNKRAARPYHDLDETWKKAVTYLSISLLKKPVCECGNVVEFINYWLTDLTRVSDEESYAISEGIWHNPFGTSMGAKYAFEQANKSGVQLPD